jgi:hypothetical protein
LKEEELITILKKMKEKKNNFEELNEQLIDFIREKMITIIKNEFNIKL